MCEKDNTAKPEDQAKDEPRPCENCGHVSDPKAKFCSECGVPFVAAKEEPQAQSAALPLQAEPAVEAKPDKPSSPPPTTSAEVAGKVATPASPSGSCGCGQDAPNDGRFCVMCGSKMSGDAPKYRLSCKSDGVETSVELGDRPVVIGKAEGCDLTLPADDYVSRRHARFTLSDGGVLLEDLGSSNGTYWRIPQPVTLKPGDEVLVGASVLRLEEIKG